MPDSHGLRLPDEFLTELTSLGVPIFTAPPGGTEFVRPHGWQSFTADGNAAQLAEWKPGHAVCAVTGGAVVVVDVDPRNEGEPDKVRVLLAELAVRVFAEIKTAGGGVHFYVAGHPDVATTHKIAGWPGVDVQSFGANVFLPGTSRPKYDGAGYVIVSEDLAALADGGDPDGAETFAGWLAEHHDGSTPTWEKAEPWDGAPLDARQTGYLTKALDGIVTDVERAGKGGRNKALHTAALKAGSYIAGAGLDQAAVIERLTAAADACGLSADDGPAQVAATIRSGLRSGKRNPHAVPAAITAESVAHEFGSAPLAKPPAEDDDEHRPAPVSVKPMLDDAALYGLPGHIVRTISPYTEAHPAALLLTLLAASGAVVGDSAYIEAGDTRHAARLWPLIVGRTAGGAKGTSLSAVMKVLLAGCPTFAEHIESGLSSGEGLIEAVRDGHGTPDDKDYDEGVADKRLLVRETEFASVLSRSRRENNSLSMVLRQAWDGGRLSTMTRKTSKLVATAPHVVVVGHITPDELRSKLSEADVAGGLMNRFMPVFSQRSRKLARGRGIPETVKAELGRLLGERIEKAHWLTGEAFMDDHAAAEWERLYEDELTRDLPDGHYASVVARSAPTVLRLALIHCLLDHDAEKLTITADHLRAAMAAWRYVEASAFYLFGDLKVSGDLSRLGEAVTAAGDAGLTRTEIRDLFAKHKTREAVDELVRQLVGTGAFELEKSSTGGRPVERVRPKRLMRPKPAEPEALRSHTSLSSPTARAADYELTALLG